MLLAVVVVVVVVAVEWEERFPAKSSRSSQAPLRFILSSFPLPLLTAAVSSLLSASPCAPVLAKSFKRFPMGMEYAIEEEEEEEEEVVGSGVTPEAVGDTPLQM